MRKPWDWIWDVDIVKSETKAIFNNEIEVIKAERVRKGVRLFGIKLKRLRTNYSAKYETKTGKKIGY